MMIYYYLQLQDPNNDFLANSIVVTFASGSDEASAVALLRNDDVPEGNETFLLTISDVGSGAQIGSPSVIQLIIRASDQPFGLLRFDEVSR